MSKKTVEKKSLSQSQCNKCKHLCCKYITQKISAPRTMLDFDGLLWQLSHENIKAFRDSSGWHLLVDNPCIHLKSNGGCSIYESRPITCREHATENCEYHGAISKTSLQFFNDFRSLDNFCKKKFKTWDTRFQKPYYEK